MTLVLYGNSNDIPSVYFLQIARLLREHAAMHTHILIHSFELLRKLSLSITEVIYEFINQCNTLKTPIHR